MSDLREAVKAAVPFVKLARDSEDGVLRAALPADRWGAIVMLAREGDPPPPELVGPDDPFGHEFGDTVGYCSKCGEAREAFYKCRQGGETIPKDLAESVPTEGSEDG